MGQIEETDPSEMAEIPPALGTLVWLALIAGLFYLTFGKEKPMSLKDQVEKEAQEIKAGWLGMSQLAKARVIWFGIGFVVALFVVWIFK